MKKITILATLIIFFVFVTGASAEDVTGMNKRLILPKNASKAANLEARVTQTAENQQTKIQNLKLRANTEIQRRVDSLNKLIAKINEMKKLSAAQKASLQAQIQTQIDGLNTLKIKIDADTDLITLKTDVQSIITDYRIFAFFIQDIHLLTAVERMSNGISNMSTVSGKLQIRLQTAQASGKDVTALNTLLTDMQAKILAAQNMVIAANAELLGLTAQGYPGNKAILVGAKTKLQSAGANLKIAGQDAKQVIGGLRDIAKEKPHPSEVPPATSSALPKS